MNISRYSLHKPSFFLITLLFLWGCPLSQLPQRTESCKINAYVDESFQNYISNRFQSENIPRIAIVPFDVPENFTPPMNPNLRLGAKLARGFQQQFLAQQANLIVEVFLQDWPGKSLDFSAGNFQAINFARNAGYDFVMVGFVDKIVDDLKIRVHTKIIDVNNSVTVWYGTTDVSSSARSARGFVHSASRGLYPERLDLFEFEERFDKLSNCTTERIFQDEYR